MTGAIIAGLVAGYGVAIPIGGVGALLVSLSARVSFRLGAGAALGVATADLLYAVVAVLGGAALAGVVAPVQTPLRYVASAVLVAIAVRTVWTVVRRHRDPAPAEPPGTVLTTPARAYLGLLGLTVLNPTTIIYFATVVLGNRLHLGGFEAAAFAGAVFAASASWQLLLAGGGSVVGKILTGPRGRLITALVSGAVIAFLAAKVLVSP